MKKNKRLVIFGLGETAEIAYEYFTHDSNSEIVAFTASDEYCVGVNNLFNIPVIGLSEVCILYPPSEVEMFIAISYTNLNRLRERCFKKVKGLGYRCATYISSKAFVWHNAKIGENCMIFENNTIQHKVTIGDGVIMWSGNHIGHQTSIEDFVYISSHVVVSGFCRIGSFSFLGVNATFNDNIKIEKDTIIGSGTLVVQNILEKGKLVIGSPGKVALKSSYDVFK